MALCSEQRTFKARLSTNPQRHRSRWVKVALGMAESDWRPRRMAQTKHRECHSHAPGIPPWQSQHNFVCERTDAYGANPPE
jgi:hypothetical protein